MIKQEAILLTTDNALTVAADLALYTAEDLLAEADHLFKLNGAVVLCTSIDSTGTRMVEYVVHESLYKANNDNFAALNDTTYVAVSNI